MKEKKAPAIRFQRFTDFWGHHNFGTISYRESTKQLSSEEYPCLEYDDVIPETGQLNKDVHAKKVQKTGIIFDNNKVLYGKLRPYLHNWIAPEFTGVATGDWWVLNPCGNNKDFLYALIQTKQFDTIANQSTGSKMPRADWKLVSSAEFYVPTIEEQRKIGKCFHIIDNIISLHQRKLAKLQRLKKSMLTKMFPKDSARVPEIRFQGFHGDWEQCKLGDVTDSFEYGLNAAAKEFDGQNKYIRITDIDDSTHEFMQSDLTSPDTVLNQANNYKLREGDILFARTGASVGKTYIYKQSDGLVYYAGFLIRARINNNYAPEFVFQTTLTSNYDKYICITSQRSGQPGVNAQEYAEFRLLIPTLEEQQKIGEFLHDIDNLITLHQRKLSKLQQIKQAMLSKLFV